MSIPETTNANHHYAYKKGYRMAMEGKPVSHMPSVIKHDPEMRTYFQQGWDQLHEEMAAAKEIDAKPPWRSRFAWFLMMLLAGIGTASLMINQMNEDNAEQQHRIDQSLFQTNEKSTPQQKNSVSLKTPTADEKTAQKLPETASEKIAFIDQSLSVIDENTPVAEEKQNKTLKLDAEAVPPENQLISSNASLESQSDEKTLSLLSKQQRLDLAASQREKQPNQPAHNLEKIQPSDIEIKAAQLTIGIANHEPTTALPTVVAKYVRKLYFFTQIANAKDQTIYHRWIYQSRIMATVPLQIKSPLYRTWSSKRLTSAWKGQWYIEVLDQHKNVIDRHSFRYIE